MLSKSDAVTLVEAEVDEKYMDTIVFGVLGEAEVCEVSNLVDSVVSVVLSVSEVECPVSAVLSETKVDEVSNLVDIVVSGVSEEKCPVSAVLGEAEVVEVSNLVESVVSVVLVLSELE